MHLRGGGCSSSKQPANQEPPIEVAFPSVNASVRMNLRLMSNPLTSLTPRRNSSRRASGAQSVCPPRSSRVARCATRSRSGTWAHSNPQIGWASPAFACNVGDSYGCSLDDDGDDVDELVA